MLFFGNSWGRFRSALWLIHPSKSLPRYFLAKASRFFPRRLSAVIISRPSSKLFRAVWFLILLLSLGFLNSSYQASALVAVELGSCRRSKAASLLSSGNLAPTFLAAWSLVEPATIYACNTTATLARAHQILVELEEFADPDGFNRGSTRPTSKSSSASANSQIHLGEFFAPRVLFRNCEIFVSAQMYLFR